MTTNYGLGSNAMQGFNLAMNNNYSNNYGMGSGSGYSFDTSNLNQTVNQADSWNWFNDAFGGTDRWGNDRQGWVSPTFGALGTLANSWLGFQQLGVARDQLGMQKEAWNMQKEEFQYQRDRRDAEEAAYAEVRNNQNKNRL